MVITAFSSDSKPPKPPFLPPKPPKLPFPPPKPPFGISGISPSWEFGICPSWKFGISPFWILGICPFWPRASDGSRSPSAVSPVVFVLSCSWLSADLSLSLSLSADLPVTLSFDLPAALPSVLSFVFVEPPAALIPSSDATMVISPLSMVTV